MTATDRGPSRLPPEEGGACRFISASGQGGHRRRRVPAGRGSRGTPCRPADHATRASDRGPPRRLNGRRRGPPPPVIGRRHLASIRRFTQQKPSPSAATTARRTSVLHWHHRAAPDGQNAGGPRRQHGNVAALGGMPRWAEKAGVHIDTVGVAPPRAQRRGRRLPTFTALDATALKSISAGPRSAVNPASDAGELEGIASSIN